MKSATRYLEAHMGGDLAAVTDGRYRRVRVDDKTLDIEVHAPEKDDWVPVSSLSQGTLDLVYLVARLGLVRLVTGDRRPPLIFDDPFVTLDDARAGRAVDAAQGHRRGLPGHLHDHVVALRRGGRCGGRARRADQRRRRRRSKATADAVAPARFADRGSGTERARLIDLGAAGNATILLGLLSAVAWGSGDFGGGLLTRRTALFSVVLVSQLVGMALAFGLSLLRGETAPVPMDLFWSVLCGVSGRHRHHRALPRPRCRADGRRGAGDRGAGGADPGRRRDRARGCPVVADAGRDRAGDRGRRLRLARERRVERPVGPALRA